MSARSIDARTAARCLTLAAAAVLAACSSSGPREEPRPAAERTVSARDAVEQSAGGEAVDIPNAALVSHERAIAAMAAKDWTEAELELEQLIAAFPAFPGPYVNLAIVYAQDGRADAARAMLEQALVVDPGHAAANNQLGILLRDAGEFDAAEAAYRRAIGTDSGYALAHYNLGVLLDLYLGRTEEALAEYETFQSLQPEPDAEVGRWIVDLSRRVAAGPDRLARESGQ